MRVREAPFLLLRGSRLFFFFLPSFLFFFFLWLLVAEEVEESEGVEEGEEGVDQQSESIEKRRERDDEEEGRGLFGNIEIGAEVDCEMGDGIRERFEDPTSLAMLGLVVTVGATLLQMLRGN